MSETEGPAVGDAAAMPGWRRSTAVFLTGQTVSLLGSMVVQYAVMWFVTLQTRSGGAVALYAIAAFLPQGLVSIFGGTLADRVDRRVLVMVSDGAIALATLGLAMLMLNGVDDLWVILVAVGVRSIGAGVQTPAVQAMVPQLVPREHLMRVNGIFQTIQSALALLAPALAGVVFGAFGIVPVFFIDVVTAAIGIALLARVTVPTLAGIAERSTGFREDLVEGARYIWHHAFVRWLMVVFAVIFVLTVAPSFVTPLMIARTWGPEVWMVTALELAFSVGMLGGGVLVSTVLAKRSRIRLIVLSTFLFAALTVALGLSPTLWFFYGVMLLVGLSVPLFFTSLTTLLQESVPADRHGRVFGYVSIVMALAIPAGMAVFGPLSDVVSVQTLLVGTGLVTAAVMAVAVAVPSGRSAIRAASAPPTPAEQPADEERAAR